MLLQMLTNSFLNVYFITFAVTLFLYATYRKVNVFESFYVGAKDGAIVIIKIVPYFLAMLIALGMLRASGAFEMLGNAISPLLTKIGMPTEILPLALTRPFSGAASNGVLAELIATHGGNAHISHQAATLMGSTETTFYVLAVYFGAVGITRVRHAIAVGLLVDVTALIAAMFFSSLLLR